MRTLVVEATLTLSLLMGMTPAAFVGAEGAMDVPEEVATTGASSEEDRDEACRDPESQGADVAWDEEGRAAGEGQAAPLWLIGDACGGVFEGGLPQLTYDLSQGQPACGEPLWQEACTLAGHEFRGWWTDPVGGIMVADADALVVVPSLEDVLDPDDARVLTLFAHWETSAVTRRIGICRQRPDGTYGVPNEFVEVETVAGEDVTWSCEETGAFCAVTRTWAGATDEDLVVEVPRRTWTLTLVADGAEALCDEVLVGAGVDLGALAARLGVEDGVVSWRALTPQGEVRLGARDTVRDLVGAGDECVLEAMLAPESVTVAFLPGCGPEEVEGLMDDVVVAADEGMLTLPACAYERPGFSFVGWACDAASDGAATLGAGDGLDVAACGEGRVELVAVWEPCQVRVSVPVVAALDQDGDAGTCLRRSALTLTNDSEAAVDLVGVEVATVDPWRLVEWGSVVEDTDVALALETADGARYDLSQGDLSRDGLVSDGAADACVRIGRGPASVRVTILCETPTTESEGELCSLRWAFRVADAEGRDERGLSDNADGR